MKVEQSHAEQPIDPSMIAVMALIRALHEHGILPAQATADVLDRRAISAVLRGKGGIGEHAIQELAVGLQKWADLAEHAHPFVPKDPGESPRS